jgi:transcriptional regulator with XRE-family HTH domain
MDNTVGEKIRKFRKRSGISQFELELRIDASPGSISRIESGQVNPTKETLQKISKVLHLTEIEQANVFGIESDFYKNYLNQLADLITQNDSNFLQNAASKFLKELSLEGILILLLEGDLIYGRAVTRLSVVPMVNKVMGKDFTELVTNWKEESFRNNMMYKVITEKVICISNKLEDFACPPLSLSAARTAQKLSGFKAGICYPLIFDVSVIGTIIYTRNFTDDFSNEKDILQELTRIISYKIGLLYKNI